MADLQPVEVPSNGAQAPERAENLGPGLGAKRQRRPSVRLGDIGEQPAAIAHEANARRGKHWRGTSSYQFHPHPLPHPHQPHRESSSAAGGGGMGRAPPKTRPLTNLVSDDGHDAPEIPVVTEDKGLHSGEENLESVVGIRRGPKEGKARRGGGPGARRVRTNWVSRLDEGMDAADLKSSGEDAGDEGYRDYDDLRREDSESPFRDYSPSDGRAARMRTSESRDVGLAAAAAEATDTDMPLETEGRDWNNGQCRSFEGGVVKAWLSGLGLGRYAPVFEIHEVDEEGEIRGEQYSTVSNKNKSITPKWARSGLGSHDADAFREASARADQLLKLPTD
ncbi:hypothetical protein Taro_025919 [Colocasia esculenta]|uniref:Uncharacterized protein n=1 Tax=Colocasia esculenta TaxID=4460 RepID=A0A843VDM1_COLES|nr:hypothetical protein [Colocasia esculenta]